MTEEGLHQLRNTSPGSAGRNRTLGLKALDGIKVPVQNIKLQCWFDEIYQRLNGLRQEQVDVLVQYGANLPEYDLVVARGTKSIKVSVKGSQDGGWGLTQSYLKHANYYNAVDQWLARHDKGILFCFVQFKDVSLSELPRVYLAWPQEIAKRLKESAAGRGETILYEEKAWSDRAFAAGAIDRIPAEWRFTAQKVDEVFSKI